MNIFFCLQLICFGPPNYVKERFFTEYFPHVPDPQVNYNCVMTPPQIIPGGLHNLYLEPDPTGLEARTTTIDWCVARV